MKKLALLLWVLGLFTVGVPIVLKADDYDLTFEATAEGIKRINFTYAGGMKFPISSDHKAREQTKAKDVNDGTADCYVGIDDGRWTRLETYDNEKNPRQKKIRVIYNPAKDSWGQLRLSKNCADWFKKTCGSDKDWIHTDISKSMPEKLFFAFKGMLKIETYDGRVIYIFVCVGMGQTSGGRLNWHLSGAPNWYLKRENLVPPNLLVDDEGRTYGFITADSSYQSGQIGYYGQQYISFYLIKAVDIDKFRIY